MTICQAPLHQFKYLNRNQQQFGKHFWAFELLQPTKISDIRKLNVYLLWKMVLLKWIIFHLCSWNVVGNNWNESNYVMLMRLLIELDCKQSASFMMYLHYFVFEFNEFGTVRIPIQSLYKQPYRFMILFTKLNFRAYLIHVQFVLLCRVHRAFEVDWTISERHNSTTLIATLCAMRDELADETHLISQMFGEGN